MTNQQILKNKKILVATTPAAGHFNPLTGLAKYLSETGNEVRWYTSVDFKKKLDRMAIQHYPFKKAMNINFENLNTIFPERAALKSTLKRMNFDMINLFANRSEECFLDIKEIYEEFAFDVVICDSTFAAIPILKSVLRVPIVVVGIMPLTEMSKDLAPFGVGLLPPSNFLERIRNGLMRFVFKNILAKESISAYEKILKRYHISGTNTPLLNLLVKQADLFLQIGSSNFEYQRNDLGKNIRFVGALGPVKEDSSTVWFDKRLTTYKRVILVTQGTVEKNFEHLIIPTLEAFKNSDYLLIVTTGGNQTQRLRTEYAIDNVIVEDYIPYQYIMPYAHVYVTNGGYGGVMESLKYKLPMVTAGVFEGKSELCARVGYFNYGIDLKTETPDVESIKKAVNSVLSDNLYRENAKRISTEFEKTHAEELSSKYINELF